MVRVPHIKSPAEIVFDNADGGMDGNDGNGDWGNWNYQCHGVCGTLIKSKDHLLHVNEVESTPTNDSSNSSSSNF